jgi:hypothetical protein
MVKLLELTSDMVPFSAINDYSDGKELIQGLNQEAFDDLIKMAGTSATGSQWYEYLTQLSMRDEPEINDPFDND